MPGETKIDLGRVSSSSNQSSLSSLTVGDQDEPSRTPGTPRKPRADERTAQTIHLRRRLPRRLHYRNPLRRFGFSAGRKREQKIDVPTLVNFSSSSFRFLKDTTPLSSPTDRQGKRREKKTRRTCFLSQLWEIIHYARHQHPRLSPTWSDSPFV